jgi:hypothetical protein
MRRHLGARCAPRLPHPACLPLRRARRNIHAEQGAQCDDRSRRDARRPDEESRMNQGNKRFSIGMALGVAVGMILYRLIFG